jgi:tetratricopeptide (TPR) repeat protein
MDVKRKSAFIAGAVAVIAAVAFMGIHYNKYQFRNKIPMPAETAVYSMAVNSQIDDAVATARRNPSAENIGTLGMVYHSAANYTEAGRCYGLAIKRKKSEWKWHYYNGYLSMEMGNADAAIHNFNEVVKLNPESFHAWYYLGEEYKNVRKIELAEESYKKAAERSKKFSATNSITRNDHFPLSTYALFKLSRLYFDTQRIGLAEETLKKLIQDEYLFGSAYRLLGTIYLSQGESDLGTKYTHRANDLIAFTSPVDTLADKLALISRSELYLLKKIDEAERSIHSDWAIQLVKQGLKHMPENRDLLSKAIKIYLWKGLNKEATDLTDRHLKLFSGQYIEIKNTGMLFYQKALYGQAAKYWEKALELKQDELAVQLYLAKSLRSTGKQDQAQELLDKVAVRYRNNPDAVADVIDLLIEFGEQEKASGLLNRMKQQSPAHPKVLRIQGEISRSRQKCR